MTTLRSGQEGGQKRVCYYYDSNVGNFCYGPGHPMKPHRIRMTHNLLLNYGLLRKMEIYRPHKDIADEMSMTKYHSDDYIRFLRSIRPDNQARFKDQMGKFNVGAEDECPVFEGLFEFCQMSAGGSVAGAVKLNQKAADIAINWAGGLHHAKKEQASGFCYVNDIVLAILELLKSHQRVLYIDIDVHHGDGVEEAFYTTDRVMTVSFHKYDGQYFPGTGSIVDFGAGKGKYYAVNCPLKDGIDDASYESVFIPILTKVMESYRPNAIVLQCGADSLAGDHLGCFNLTLKGHGKCVEFVKKYDLPLLLLGGGGYTIRNVARCWTYETAVALGTDIDNDLPFNDYLDYYGPGFKLHISPSSRANANTPKYVEKIKTRMFENLRMLPCAPGVQMMNIPEAGINLDDIDEEAEEGANPDQRISVMASDKRVSKDNEFSDSDDDGEGRRDQRLSVNAIISDYNMASSDPDGGATRGKRKRKKGMPLTSCLVCFNASTPTSSDWIKVGGHYDHEYSCLNSHLSLIFVLRNYLDYPKEECQRLLQKMGEVGPEEWFRLCASCSNQVQQCLEAFQQSPQCQEVIVELRTKAHETLRSSFYTEDCIRRTRIVDDDEEVDSAIWARTDVRKYFRGLLLPVQEKRQEDLSQLPKVCPVRPVCNYEPDNPGFMKTHLGSCKHRDPSSRQSTTSSRSHHRHQSAEESNKPFFQCDKCDFIGKDRNARYWHLKRHKLDDNVVFLPSGHFSCTVCSAVFDKHLKIHLHLRQSHGEQLGLKTYQCSYCGEFFNSQTRLKAHTTKHTGSFRFSCDKCYYRCNERRDLKNHQAARHFVDRGDPVSCEYCGRVYQTEGLLRRHFQNVHFKTKFKK